MNESDPLVEQVKTLARARGWVGVSYLQRFFRIGYAHATRLIDALVAEKFLERMGPDDHRFKVIEEEAAPILTNPIPCPWCLSDDTECIDDEHEIYQCLNISCFGTFARATPEQSPAVDRSGPSPAG